MAITPQATTPGTRRKVTKFALVGVAILGVGGALTSAAWSDDVFFQGSASTGTFELQGYDEIAEVWVDADSDTLAITLPDTAFDNVGPGIADSHVLEVKNSGTIDIDLDTAPVTFEATGALFSGDDPATVSFGGYSDTALAPEETATVTVTVTGDEDWDNQDYLGATGTLTVQITGNS